MQDGNLNKLFECQLEKAVDPNPQHQTGFSLSWIRPYNLRMGKECMFKAPRQALKRNLLIGMLAFSVGCATLPKAETIITPKSRPEATHNRPTTYTTWMNQILDGKATAHDIISELGIDTAWNTAKGEKGSSLRIVNSGVSEQWAAAQTWAHGRAFKAEVLKNARFWLNQGYASLQPMRVFGAWATPRDVDLKQFLQIQDSLFQKGFSRYDGQTMASLLDPEAWERIQNSHLGRYPLACAFSFVETCIRHHHAGCKPGLALENELASHEAFCRQVVLDSQTTVLHLSNNAENRLSPLFSSNFGDSALFYPANVWRLAQATGAKYHLWQGSGKPENVESDNAQVDAFLDSIRTAKGDLFIAIDGHGAPEEITFSTVRDSASLVDLRRKNLYDALKERASSVPDKCTTIIIDACYSRNFATGLLKSWKRDIDNPPIFGHDLGKTTPPAIISFSPPDTVQRGMPMTIISALAENVQDQTVRGEDLVRWLEAFNFSQERLITPTFFYHDAQKQPVSISGRNGLSPHLISQSEINK